MNDSGCNGHGHMEALSIHSDSTSRILRVEHFDYDDLLYYVLALVGLVLICFWSRSRVPGSEFHVWERRRAQLQELEARTERMSNPEYRLNLILNAIVIKKIIQEKAGQLLLGDDDGAQDSLSANSSSHSIDSMDENANTCAICLESFHVGDVVAWSRILLDPNEPDACSHVFHKECLLSWLMHGPTHDACPSCRSPIVKESEVGGKGEQTECSSSSSDSVRGANSVFVIMHGLVSRIRRVSASMIGENIPTTRDDSSDGTDTDGGCPRKTSAQPSTLQSSMRLTEEGRVELVPLRTALRRRPFTSSSSSLPDDSIPQSIDPGSPVSLRRIVSDIPSLLSATFHGPPRPSRFGQAPMLPYPSYMRKTSSFGSISSGDRDVSESTIAEEEELIVRPVSPLTVEMSESEMLDETEFHSDQDHDFV